ncbi:MAG: TonB-dependent receptor [bacterium]
MIGQQHPIVDSRNVQVPLALLDSISVQFKNVPLKEALHTVAEKGQFKLNYNENLLNKETTVTLSMDHQPAFLVLKEILHDESIDIIVMNKNQVILVKKKSRSGAALGESFTMSGYITDAESGEALLGATVYLRDLTLGTTANAYGFYSITLSPGNYIVQFRYMGYITSEVLIELESDVTNNVHLQSSSIKIDTVVVVAEFEELSPRSPRLGTVQLNPSQLSTIPLLLGEQDLLKILQLLPGVSNPREGDCGIYVRGGNADQNLLLLDEATIYSPFHTFGLFSIFNSDAIRNVRMMKGTAPAKYGGRVSSVIDMQMKEGNMKEFNGTAGIGLIFSRLMLEGPILNDKASFLISGRRTYFDFFTALSSDASDAKFHFYDLNAKVNYKINERDRVYLSGYFGRDGIGFSDAFDMNWGNSTGTVRWNHLFSNKLFLNSSLILSNFKYQLDAGGEAQDDDHVEWISEVSNIALKEDFEYFQDAQNTFGFGLNYIHHSFLPAQFSVMGSANYKFTIGKKTANEFNTYASHEHTWNDNIKLEYGIRASLFTVAGEADNFDIEDAGELYIDFHRKEDQTYANLQPRISATFTLDEFSSIKAGYARNFQYLHMLSNSNSGTPLDIWQPSSSAIKPQISDQISMGYVRSVLDNTCELSAEIYYKDLRNQIDYKDGANFLFKNYFDSELVFGKGWAYGTELLVKKNSGNLTGWIAYTLSTSKREFEQINGGQPYFAANDKTHELNIVAQYKVSDHWSFSANSIYASGFNITLPYGRYSVFGKEVLAYTERNGYRLPSYHRLDLGVTYITDGGGIWSLNFYNALGRRNIYTVLFRDKSNQPGMKEAVKLSLFPMIPSLSYTFTL